MRARLLAAALALLAGATAALACPVCIDLPEATLAERLLRAEAIVIAREDPARPFRYAPVAALKGDAAGPPIPLLLDSATRRRLSLRPEDGVLMLRDRSGAWAHGGYGDAAWRAAAAAILGEGPSWRDDPAARFAYFETLLRHEDANLRRLAVDELSRARYGLIRTMAQPLDGETARRALADLGMIPWAPFHVLMLGLSARPEDHALVRRNLDSAARTGGGRLLGALATALVEIDGAAGVDRLVRAWLSPSDRDAEALRAVVIALGVQARDGDPALRPTILAALRALPERRPEVAGTVAATLGDIGDFSQADAIETALLGVARHEGVAGLEAELMAASLYVHRARRASTPQASEPELSP